MPAPIELALSTLLPTISFLPPDLIALANSLLSQSRAKAPNLKPEEEIARTYACAHIACQRMRMLEMEKPKPPCNPRVYAKLLGFLEGILGTSRTPRKGTPSRSGSTQQNGTPSRSAQHGAPKESAQQTPTSNKRKRGTIGEDDDPTTPRPAPQQDNGLPASVTSLTRTICNATSTSNLIPHILVGARAVKSEIESRATTASSEPKRRKKRTTPQKPVAVEVSIKWPALILALHTLAYARNTGLETLDQKIQDMKRKGIKAVQNEEKVFEKDIGFYMLEAEDCGWLEMEWFRNIPEEEEYEDDEEEEEEEVVHEVAKKTSKTPLRRKEKHNHRPTAIEDDYVPAAGLLPGLGTMFQPAIDWLSDERREEYRLWKKDIMREIIAVEKAAAAG